MRIILTGGGTGGHITPLLAVAHELKLANPDCTVIYIGERNGKFAHLTDDNPDIDEIHTIFAGKFRRYHGESWLKRLVDVRTNLYNLRDLVYVALGLLQSLFLIPRLRPDVILLKGGFVGVPVGLGASLWRKPFITHDSDAMPGLANRLVSRWATYNATGMPTEFYSYPPDKARYVGVLVGDSYKPVTGELQNGFKQQLSIPVSSRVLVVTGGSHGAKRLNDSFLKLAPKLLEDYDDLHIIHQAGKGHAGLYGQFAHARLSVQEFLQPIYIYTGAADVVVTRAGANTLAELGVQGKACVVVPNPLLTGGHQLKNAENLMRKGAVVAVDETEFKKSSEGLNQAIRSLLQDADKRKSLAQKFQAVSVPDAARKLAVLLLDIAKH